MAKAETFHHEALFYAGDEEFVQRCRAFVEDGLDRDEPVLVMVGARKLALLRAALGERASDVALENMEVVGRNPARIIPAWARFVSDHADGAGSGGMRGVGEPVWAGRNAAELSECQLHESLINLAFAAANSFRLICPYDSAALPDDVIAEARRSHPIVSNGVPHACEDYRGIDGVADDFHAGLPDPPERADQVTVNVTGLRDARRMVRQRAIDSGLAERADDFALAVNEILSNSLHHAHEDGLLQIWEEPDGLVCEVRDSGQIVQPLIGREEPAAGQVGGHGVWLVNLVCDLVQVRSSPGGSVVRMKMSRA